MASDSGNGPKSEFLRIRLADGTEAVLRKEGNRNTTVAEALSSLGGRFQVLAEQIAGEPDLGLAQAIHDTELDSQVREIGKTVLPPEDPSTRDLIQRIEELERRVEDLENRLQLEERNV